MTERLTLLLTSAGRRVELAECFRESARELGIGLRLLACDMNPRLSAACLHADKSFEVPSAISPDYVDRLLSIVAAEGVDVVVPTIDPELPPLAAARDRFAAAGADLSVSSSQLVDMARDKLATATFLEEAGIPAPRTTCLAHARSTAWAGPVFAKPRHGSSGRHARAVASVELVEDPGEPMVVQELLRGTEFTVNLYFDRSGRMLAAVPHERLRVRAGEVEKGITRRSATLQAIAGRLAEVLPSPRGALCFQAIVDDAGRTSVFEINARFGGGYPLAHRAGAAFTRWLLEERLGRTPAPTEWTPDLLMVRHDRAIFVQQ